LLAKFHQSQLAQREFSNQHAIGMPTLSKWLRLERNAIPAKVKFQEVRLPTWHYSTRQTATRCLSYATPATSLHRFGSQCFSVCVEVAR
jgi:hypothetical protein